MPTKRSKAKRKRSATTAALDAAPVATQQQMCRFPTAFLSDFVVHYHNTAFHVHKLVLCCHSSYFRTYIEQLIDGQRAYPKSECDDHPGIPHCIRLPDSCGKVAASEDDFRLFLCHLYFAQHYSCVPYKADVEVDVAATPGPAITLNCPSHTNMQSLRAASSSKFYIASPPAIYEAVLSLCHYFDCALVLSRAEDNCLLVVQSPKSASDLEVEWNGTWPCFLLALQFDLHRLRKVCIVALAKYHIQVGRHKEEWEGIRAQLGKDTLYELLQAAFRVSPPK